jgi:hypothetical protein
LTLELVLDTAEKLGRMGTLSQFEESIIIHKNMVTLGVFCRMITHISMPNLVARIF